MYPNLNVFGMEIGLYRTMYVVGVIGMFVICVLCRKKYKTGLIRAVIYTLVTFVFGVAGAKLMSKIYVASMTAVSDGAYVPDSGVCIFGALMFLPVFMGILSLVGGERYRKLMDYMTPGIFFVLACAKFGCLLSGCCYGIASEHGVYNQHLDYLVFPVQLYESLCTVAVVVILLVMMAKRGKVRYGSLYPIGTILYCTARLIWENFRYYEHEWEYHFFLGLTDGQCWAVIAVVVSIIWLVILYTNKKYAKCELERNPHYLREWFDTRSAEMSAKQKEKHKAKAKEHAQKAKELKNKQK